MRLGTYLLLFGISFGIFAQNNCECINELEFVSSYYERNLPGFKDNVTEDTRQEYDMLLGKLKWEAEKAGTAGECFKLLTYYVEYFKDNHSKITMPSAQVDEQDEAAVEKFRNSEAFRQTERITLDQSHFGPFPFDDIRGIYEIYGGVYTIAVIESPGPFRSYVGVILESESKLWDRGQVKLEIGEKPGGGYFAMEYLRNHSIRYEPNFHFENGVLGNNWVKMERKSKINQATSVDGKIDFRIINDSISYLRIPSFSGSMSARLDSLYQATEKFILNTSYLIVDVRNNGGGSDFNVRPLLHYFYTRPIKGDKVELYVTPDNLKVWEEWYAAAKKDTNNYKKEDLEWFENEISRQKKANPYSFITRSKGNRLKWAKSPDSMKKVAILFNRNCASSCETLLFWAQQSDKAMLLGENSGGYVGYGEVGRVKTPCYGFNLYCTMTRYDKQRAYEVVGIPPQRRLRNDVDWIEQTIDILKE